MAWRKCPRRQRSICPPAHVGRSSCLVQSTATKEAEVEEKPSERREPETKGIQARKRHVARANHQRREVIGKTEKHGHGHEENHGCAMHGEHPVEHLWRDKIV